MINRESVTRFLLRRPTALQSRTARWTVLTLTATGAGFLVWSAVIHLMLWSDGYKDISVIGPLFLVQAIASIVLAVLLALVAFAVYLPAPALRAAIVLAVVLAAALWLAQGMGELFTGMATDPESGPLLALLALAFWPAVPTPAVPVKEA